jgi:NADH:ubiquinone oxidoreductase subunit 3 (subunit A)
MNKYFGIALIQDFIILFAIIIFITVMSIRKERQESHKITLYSSDGKEIKRWVSEGSMVFYSGHCEFSDKYSDGNNKVIISGTIIVE